MPRLHYVEELVREPLAVRVDGRGPLTGAERARFVYHAPCPTRDMALIDVRDDVRAVGEVVAASIDRYAGVPPRASSGACDGGFVQV